MVLSRVQDGSVLEISGSSSWFLFSLNLSFFARLFQTTYSNLILSESFFKSIPESETEKNQNNTDIVSSIWISECFRVEKFNVFLRLCSFPLKLQSGFVQWSVEQSVWLEAKRQKQFAKKESTLFLKAGKVTWVKWLFPRGVYQLILTIFNGF